MEIRASTVKGNYAKYLKAGKTKLVIDGICQSDEQLKFEEIFIAPAE